MTKATANTVIILIVLGILVLINMLAGDMHSRWDLTADKLYTLSETSREVVANLTDELIVTLYSSDDLPTRERETRKKVIDLIDEYKVYANANFIFREEHPDIEDEDKVKELGEKGIVAKQLGGEFTGRSKTTEVGIGYLDLLISYGAEKPEPIPQLEHIDSLEYRITHSIFKLTMEDMPTIGLYGGAGINPMSQEGGFSKLGQVLGNQYPVQNVDLSKGEPVPDKVKTMIILSPDNFGSKVKVALDQFIMRGGKVVFLLDTVDTSMEQGARGKRKPTPWADFLNNYGLKVDNSLVVDLGREDMIISVPIPNSFFANRYWYPLWLIVKKDGFGELGFTSNLEASILPWASPVEYTKDPSDESIESAVVFSTTEEAYLMKEPYNLAFDQFREGFKAPSEQKMYDLGIMVSGIFQSFYTGKEIPTVQNAEGVQEVVWDPDDITETSPKTELILIGCSNMFSDTRIDQTNAIFLMNMIDSLSLGKGLIELRSRTVTDRSLKSDLTDGDKAFIKFSGIYLIPILLSLIGIGRYVLRVQTKKMVEAKTLGRD